MKVPFSGDSEVGDSIVLVVEHFEHIGSDGSKTFGDPRYVQFNPAVKTSLERPAPPSPTKDSQSQRIFLEYSFTQTLDPSDLLFLESTCTLTYQRQMRSFPQVITDDDWKIPEDQVKILASIKLTELSDFEYGKSDVELSDEEKPAKPPTPKRNRIRFIMEPQTQAQVNNAEFLTQTPHTLTQTLTSSPKKTFTQNEVVVFPETQEESQILFHSPSKSAKMDSQTFLLSPSKSAKIDPQTLSLSPSKSAKMDLLLSQSPSKTVFLDSQRLSQSPTKINAGPLAKAVVDSETEKVPSSPINSPIKQSASSFGSFSQSPSKRTNESVEYPDYSSW